MRAIRYIQYIGSIGSQSGVQEPPDPDPNALTMDRTDIRMDRADITFDMTEA